MVPVFVTLQCLVGALLPLPRVYSFVFCCCDKKYTMAKVTFRRKGLFGAHSSWRMGVHCHQGRGHGNRQTGIPGAAAESSHPGRPIKQSGFTTNGMTLSKPHYPHWHKAWFNPSPIVHQLETKPFNIPQAAALPLQPCYHTACLTPGSVNRLLSSYLSMGPFLDVRTASHPSVTSELSEHVRDFKSLCRHLILHLLHLFFLINFCLLNFLFLLLAASVFRNCPSLLFDKGRRERAAWYKTLSRCPVRCCSQGAVQQAKDNSDLRTWVLRSQNWFCLSQWPEAFWSHLCAGCWLPRTPWNWEHIKEQCRCHKTLIIFICAFLNKRFIYFCNHLGNFQSSRKVNFDIFTGSFIAFMKQQIWRGCSRAIPTGMPLMSSWWTLNMQLNALL